MEGPGAAAKVDQVERKRLFMPELFHWIQPRLGLTTGGAGLVENSHLDSLEGRYWMRLEWRAPPRARQEAWGLVSSRMIGAIE